ncbi:calcium/sodium antiporter [Mesorhizobium neociceri]|uniref:Calcium/sodium antiporter n=1 Tax=Mesorhizobium neociceri TaxID=1307853 RepID=A0A838B0X4_9HYPH|nr:calcium/sodium antiporter [Mesorhizobium neociceri]MBA1139995.1 calcium/sodium antiporter [Mesorhizobium neociceri]
MYLSILAGLFLLIVGGELLVRGSVGVAAMFGVSPLLIGLTLVGFGTSAPELVTSIQAALAGSPGIAIGNIVGSNIANSLLILGVTAVVAPVAVQSQLLKRDGLVLIAVTALFIVIGATVPLGRLVGLVFVAMLCAYVYLAYRQERSPAVDGQGAAVGRGLAAQQADPGFVPPANEKSVWLPLILAFAGLGMILFGSDFLVDGAVRLAHRFGISETVVGLTIVAVGTSMPELATSVVASLRGQSELALGNVLGSCLYNILGIGGATAIVSPISVPSSIVHFDFPVLFVVTLLILAFAWSGRRIERNEGLVLLACYAAYIVVLIW